MRKLRDILRLKAKDETGLSHGAIARACSIGVEHGLGTPAARGGGGPAVARARRPGRRRAGGAALYPSRLRHRRPARAARLERLHQECKRPGVTLHLLWLEYRDQHPTGSGYSQFCDRSRRGARTLKPSMRQVHPAGEQLFVDFAGQKPQLVDGTTGEVVCVELFVGVLGASGLIDAEATRTQEVAAWVDG